MGTPDRTLRDGSATARTPGGSALLASSVMAAAFLLVGLLGTNLPTRFAELRPIAHITAGAVLGAWFVIRRWPVHTRVDYAILAALGLHGVAALAGRDLLTGLESTGLALGYVVLFAAMRDVARYPRYRAAVATGVVSAATTWLCVVGLGWMLEKVAWTASGGGLPPLESSMTFIWDSPNVPPFLTLLGFGFIPFLQPGRLRRVLVVAFVVASLVVVPLSVGRAAWLGLTVAAMVSGWLLSSGLERRGASVRRVIIGTALGTAVLGLLAVQSGQLDTRLTIWSQAVGIFGAQPVTGAGPGSFSWLRLAYYPDYGNPTVTEHAHNLLLQSLADGGLLLALGLLAIAIVYGQEWLSGPQTERSTAEILAFAAVLGFLAASQLDHVTAFNAVIAMFVGLAAWAVPVRERQVAPSALVPLSGRLLPIVIAAIVTLPAVYIADTARVEASTGRLLFHAGEFVDAASHFSTAASLSPANAGYRLQHASALLEAGDVSASTSEFQKAMELSPGDPRPIAALAHLHEKGDEQLRLLDRASRLGAGDPQYALMLGSGLQAADLHARARDTFALAIMLNAASLQHLPRDRGVRAAAVDRVPELLIRLADVARLDPAAVLGDLRLATGKDPADPRPAWRAVDAALRDDPADSHAYLSQARHESPHSRPTYWAAIAVGRLTCNDALVTEANGFLAILDSDVRWGWSGWDPTYRDHGLGDYQFDNSIHVANERPLTLIDVDDCVDR